MAIKTSVKESSPPEDSSSTGSSPPSDSSSSNNSSSSSSPPPPSDSSSSSPPPPSSSTSSPPPPSSDNQSPPPPSGSGSQSPPPPSGSDSKSPPPPSDSSSGNNDNKSPPPPSGNNDNNKSPPPPPPSPSNSNNNNSNDSDDNNNNNNNYHPPPPPSSNHNRTQHPPPPPHSPTSHSPGALAPPKAKSQSTNSNNDSGLSDNEKAIIAGVAAGAGLLLLIMVVCLVACCTRKKRKRRHQMHYYTDGSGGRNDYYNNGAGWHGPPSDHVVKMPHSAAMSSEHGWPAGPPPPPPPMMSSSELSSAAFSGPYHAAPPPPPPAMSLGFNQSSFTYEDLAAATGGFAKSNLLGQGGFGFVHKGVLPNGKEIAVKSLKSNSGQGEREFQAEVDIISRVHHRHLVSLVGYCIAGNQRMLVYEFVPNNTLEYHLHGTGRPTMDFPTRLKIALGSAKGFAYLHEDCHPRIIHRDIKAANILLDENMEAKVADFGLAKLSSDTHTHVSTRIMGTFGYLAPEYASSGKLTEKSDVYSYGVMLLELITGRRPIDMSRDDDDSLIDWARPILTQVMEGGSYEELVDPGLENNYDPHEMMRLVACAAACIRHSARRRPKMSQIVRALEGDVSLDDLHEGVKPGHSSVFGSSGSSEYDASSYNSDVKKFRKTGLSSQEFTSSGEHATGEFVRSSGGESQEMRPVGIRPGMRNTP